MVSGEIPMLNYNCPELAMCFSCVCILYWLLTILIFHVLTVIK